MTVSTVGMETIEFSHIPLRGRVQLPRQVYTYEPTGAANACPSRCGSLARRAIFRCKETPNQWPNSGRPVPTRGAVARRHERGMGCGGRESVGAQVRSQGELNLVSGLRACKTNDVFLLDGFTAYAVLLCPQNLPECANGRFSPTAR